MASSKAETGEIDTRTPFESVKAAVSLFGEGAFSRKKKTPIRRNLSKPPRSIRKLHVVEEDRVLQFPEKVINSSNVYNNAEITKNRALEELAKAKRTVEELNHMIQSAATMTMARRESANTKVGGEMLSSFDQLHSSEEEMERKVEELRIEVESSRRNLEETEKKLRISQKETEEAKASEAMALNQLRIFISEQRKSEPEEIELEDMKIVTKEAVRRAERAEKEVQRWRQREHKKIAELASRILQGKDNSSSSSSSSLYRRTKFWLARPL